MSVISIPGLALFISILPWHALAVVHSSASSLTGKGWDYIVVGGGTGGSVVASRLSEDASVSVLLIEAGGDNNVPNNSAITVPFLATQSEVTGSPFNWNYTSVAQPALGGRTQAYPRGFVLGGTSSINGMAYTRGASDDYDRLAKVSGDSGWSWKKLVPYFLRSEKHVASADGHNTAGQYDPAWHGNGPVLTSLPGWPSPIDNRVLATTKELPNQFPFDEEMNDGTPLGVGWLQSTIGNSVRSSSATAYLSASVQARSNLDILINTRATRLVQTGTSDGVPEFKGVEIAESSTATPSVLNASREVILSAGSIGTPQLLLLSGIGNATELEALGINTTVSSPEVGKALHDQPFAFFQWSVNSTNTLDSLSENETLFNQALEQYQSNGTGILVDGTFGNQVGFVRLPAGSNIPTTVSGPGAPNFEIGFINGFASQTQATPSTGHYITGAVILLAPTSRGSVTLSSASAFDAPLINPGVLSTEEDIDSFVAGVQILNTFFAADAWKDYIIAPTDGSPDYTSKDSIAAYLRANAIAVTHVVASARIIDTSTGDGVVNADLTVRGTKGLRVVDASVMPYVPSGHTQAPVYAIAERAVDLIKQSS